MAVAFLRREGQKFNLMLLSTHKKTRYYTIIYKYFLIYNIENFELVKPYFSLKITFFVIFVNENTTNNCVILLQVYYKCNYILNTCNVFTL